MQLALSDMSTILFLLMRSKLSLVIIAFQMQATCESLKFARLRDRSFRAMEDVENLS